MSARGARLPAFLRRLSSDEYAPPPRTPRERRAAARVIASGESAERRTGVSQTRWAEGRRGTAAGLRALNAEAGAEYYLVPREAELDEDAAREALGGDEVVIDVQTHFVADREGCRPWNANIRALYEVLRPDWWRGMDDLLAYDLTSYLRCVFIESETAVAVLTSAPGLGPNRMLFDHELAAARELGDRLGPRGRLLNHSIVHPDVPGGLDAMDEAGARYRPAGWKVYTLGNVGPTGTFETPGWFLDDAATGIPFLERARASGVRRVCAHKGISALVPTGAPRDVGPAARAFPDLDFLIYHSAYEVPSGSAPEEGPFTPETAHLGTNRLVATLRASRVAPGANVYAELGSTWFCLIRRPEEAAHVLGKLLLAVGEDRVLWGTDSIWYGPAQPAIDAFRAFQIPEALRERWGYPELTPAVKRKILGANAARVYGIDLAAARAARAGDDLAWVGDAVREWRRAPGGRRGRS